MKKFTAAVGVIYLALGILFFLVDGYLGYREVTRLFSKQTLENLHVIDSKLGWKLKASSRGHHQAAGSFDVTYEIDENGHKKVENPGSPSRSLYFIGDSFTFGHGVSNADTFPNLLADRYLRDDIAVYNLGVMGYGITQMAVRFLEIEPKLRPGDLVIFSPTTPDLTRDVFSFTMPMCLIFSNRVAPFKNFPVFENGQFEYRQLDNLVNRLRLFAEFAPCTGRFLRLIESEHTRADKVRANREMNQRIIEFVKERVEKKGARFCLFFLPMQNELMAQGYATEVEYLNPFSIGILFDRKLVPAMCFPEGHWNSLGHQMAAEAVMKLLLANHFLDRDELKEDAPLSFLPQVKTK